MSFLNIFRNVVSNKPDANLCYKKAKEIAGCLFDFPYKPPSEVPLSVKKETEIYDIIKQTYKTTIALDGSRKQTDIKPSERIRLQSIFKKRIYNLLEECLSTLPDFAPAYLLYVKVAEFNTRAADRKPLISLYERFYQHVDSVTNGTTGYSIIQEDIKFLGGNCFDKVERHLADFHYDLAVLYAKTGSDDLAKIEYKKACGLCPKVYGKGPQKVKLP
ncbi:MAG: hypothetical protein AB7E55_01180 [Pigmentiphaga sp.]